MEYSFFENCDSFNYEIKERSGNMVMKEKNIYVQIMRFLFFLMIVLFHMRGIEGLDDKGRIFGYC